ncbi:hypothetical protein TVAG_291120 [Trichomonas vaginalis G3]|uniref:Uncharacterized protein n=1 Tax=Trichomonas vaginalis (strain ATCC PRA-98 / G3) TaxID=412133 RepID=A2GDF6_TRIV3|nr:hypothetical protein TVAGG3_0361040 [Trichomonas vaginalis G3]EAX84810.1 hypothetical protein TVAG_291120 [Trichomonas vaginalis G3]KAI5531937.1 hypothetical protein TVAGG3_0361040 [Trichomonas vaginalis G3]|eukprot:XP_001297740.1 hypothetical protein [Trichomonas vaginalis G3]
MLDMTYVQDILSTRKMRKFRCVSPQNMKDHDDILQRINQNGIKMDLVTAIIESSYGGHITIEPLLSFANKMAKKYGLNLDRLAKRNRSALLCWYTENWATINTHIADINPYRKEKLIQKLKESKSPIPNQGDIDPSDIGQLLNYH